MAARYWRSRSVHRIGLFVALVALGWAFCPVASAAEIDKLDTSAKLVPEDAAFYSSILRTREQFELLRHSKAWAKVEQMPFVQLGVSMYTAQLANADSGPAKFDAALKNPEVRKIVDLLGEMVSDEMFVYGDDSCTDFLQLCQTVASAVRYGPMTLQATGQAKAQDASKLQAKLALSALAQHVDLLDVPNVVFGFKVKNADLAKEELIKLEMFGNMLEANEKTKGAFKKTKIGDSDFLVLELDGDLIPWGEMPSEKLENLELAQGDIEKIVDKLKESKLVVALGLRGNYLVASIGSTLECLEKLGKGKRLLDRAEFKPLAKFADKRLVSIGYVSEDMNQQLNNQKENFDNVMKMADKLLPLAKLTNEQNERIRKDLKSLADDLKSLTPEPGALAGFGFLTDRGIENYTYAWGDHDRVDGSKPLSLLQHVGGNPIFAVVSRAHVSAEQYDGAIKWVKTAYAYVEELALPKVPEGEREKVKKFLAAAGPSLVRLDNANRTLLIPALADGQSALVIDGKLQSKHFIASLPATDKPMPMFEPALVMGVSDAKLLKQGLSEYQAGINGLLDAIRGIEGVTLPPEIKIPEPQKAEGPAGTIYSFALPAGWGVDEQVAPCIGIANDALVFATSRAHTERLLKATPLAAGGLLQKTDRPLAAAVWFDWATLVNTASPWVDFGVEKATAAKGIAGDQKKAIVDQVHTGLEVLKAIRSVSSENFVEDGVLVQHSLVEIHDVP